MRVPGPALALLAVQCLATIATAGEPTRRLEGIAPRTLARLAPAGVPPADMPMTPITVYLGLRDRERLDGLIAAQQDRHAPEFRRWRDAAELGDRFGPRRHEYERVRRWFAAEGFEIVRESPYRLTLTVAGTAALVERALGAPIRLFRQGARVHHAPTADPALPESIAGAIVGILGLDDLPKFRPLARPAVRVDEGEGFVALAPADFATAYQVTPLQAAGLRGTGRSIAVVARSNFRDSDVHDFAARYVGPSAPSFERSFVNPNRDPGILPDPGEEIEVLLDTQWAGALAPGANVKVVISPPPPGNIPDSLEKAVQDREGDVISISFSLCETDGLPAFVAGMFDTLYALANAQGQTVLVASGDSGAAECEDGRGANVLASSPHAVAVGGTSFALAPDGSVVLPVDERAWGDDLGAGGGGESARFALPRFQLAAGLATLSPRRMLPDLALAASPRTPGYVVVVGSRARQIGGASAGAPALASVLALVNERLAETEGASGLGQLLPALYRAASAQVRGQGPAVFRDVTAGRNDFGFDPGHPAGPGFDLATGWGAPLADALLDTLTAPGRCEPETDCLVPAIGPRREACSAEWLLEQPLTHDFLGLPRPVQSCRDGDPACDVDGVADGRCTVSVAVCLNVDDQRPAMVDAREVPRCEPGVVRSVRPVAPRAGSRARFAAANRRALRDALDTLPDLPTALRSACTATTTVLVPARARARGGTRLEVRVEHGDAAAPSTTVARLRLRCVAS